MFIYTCTHIRGTGRRALACVRQGDGLHQISQAYPVIIPAIRGQAPAPVPPLPPSFWRLCHRRPCGRPF